MYVYHVFFFLWTSLCVGSYFLFMFLFVFRLVYSHVLYRVFVCFVFVCFFVYGIFSGALSAFRLWWKGVFGDSFWI